MEMHLRNFLQLKNCVNGVNVPHAMSKKLILIIIFSQQTSNTICLNNLKCYFYSFLTLVIDFYSFTQKLKSLSKIQKNLQEIDVSSVVSDVKGDD